MTDLVTPLSDGELHLPATALLNRDLPAEFLDADGLMAVNFGGFLIRTGDHTVVVDTGIGRRRAARAADRLLPGPPDGCRRGPNRRRHGGLHPPALRPRRL